MNSKKKIDIFLSTIILIALFGIIIYSAYQIYIEPRSVVNGNITYYFESNSTLKYSVRRANDKIIEYIEYFPQTRISDAQEVKIIYTVDESGYITTKQEFEKGTGKIISISNFVPRTRYGDIYERHVKYHFIIENDVIKYAIGYDENSNKINNYFEYHNNTKYGDNHNMKIKTMYYIDENGYIEYSEEKDILTNKTTTKSYYLPKTRYDTKDATHISKIDREEKVM